MKYRRFCMRVTYLNVTFFIIVLFFIYALNSFTPLYSDDWHYNFIYGTLNDIDSLGDIIKSQYVHYFEVNGRFVPHFFVQLFDGLLGKGLFDIFNSFSFIIFLFLCTYTLKKEYKSFFVSSFLILFLCFFLIPSFNNCFLWMSGACNYLWVANILLIFNILLFNNVKCKMLYPLLFVFGVISGWTNEALIVGLSVGYFIYFFIHRDRLTTSQVILLCGFYIGVILLVFSPGSLHRALGNNEAEFSVMSVLHNIISALLQMDNIRLFPLFILVLCYSIYKKKIILKEFIGDNIIWIVALFVEFCFILFTRHDSGHSRFGFEFFSLILIMKLLSKYLINKYFIWGCSCFLILIGGYVLKLSWLNNEEYKQCITQLQKGKNVILTNEVKCKPYFERFIVRFLDSESSDVYSGFMNQKWIANRYGKDSLFFIPQRIYIQIQESPDTFDDIFYTNEELPFYVMRKGKHKNMTSAMFILEEVNYRELPIYLRFIAPKLERYNAKTISSHKVSVISLFGSDYIFVGKNNLVSSRVKKIRINTINYNVVKEEI